MTMRKNFLGGQSVSMDLPPSIESLLNMPSASVNQQALGSLPVANTGGMARQPIRPMQAGGPVPSGVGLQPSIPQGGPSNPAVIKNGVNQMMAQNPEATARIRASVEAALSSGELTTQDLNMLVQLAETVLQNPSLWPQIRQMAIQKGLASEADLPVEYDEGLVSVILSIGNAMQADVQFQDESLTMPQGGMVQGPSHAQGGVPLKSQGGALMEAEGEEYMIPKHIVRAKGTEFFDKMLEQYSTKGKS